LNPSQWQSYQNAVDSSKLDGFRVPEAPKSDLGVAVEERAAHWERDIKDLPRS
jgi:hypothetical protein